MGQKWWKLETGRQGALQTGNSLTNGLCDLNFIFGENVTDNQLLRVFFVLEKSIGA